MEPQLDDENLVSQEYIDKAHIMAAVAKTEAGVAFLQWLCTITGFNRPIMAMEDACRRDVWLTIRRFIPHEKLAEIEHRELREQQQLVREMLEVMGVKTDD